MFLSFTAAGRNWNESERNDSAVRPMFNGRFAAANGAEKSFTPELILSRRRRDMSYREMLAVAVLPMIGEVVPILCTIGASS